MVCRCLPSRVPERDSRTHTYSGLSRAVLPNGVSGPSSLMGMTRPHCIKFGRRTRTSITWFRARKPTISRSRMRRRKERESNSSRLVARRVQAGCRRQSACPSRGCGGRNRTCNRLLNREPPLPLATRANKSGPWLEAHHDHPFTQQVGRERVESSSGLFRPYSVSATGPTK